MPDVLTDFEPKRSVINQKYPYDEWFNLCFDLNKKRKKNSKQPRILLKSKRDFECEAKSLIKMIRRKARQEKITVTLIKFNNDVVMSVEGTEPNTA